MRHGHAASLPLGRVLAYNAHPEDCVDARGPEHVRDVVRRILRALGARRPGEVEAMLARFRRLAGLEEWSDVTVDPASVAAQAATYGRLSNNPRRLSPERLQALLEDRSPR
jgi:alcohol dehydrogenase class IV